MSKISDKVLFCIEEKKTRKERGERGYGFRKSLLVTEMKTKKLGGGVNGSGGGRLRGGRVKYIFPFFSTFIFVFFFSFLHFCIFPPFTSAR